MFSRGGIFAGCASARVWHKSGSISPTTQKEVDIALSECEYRTEVATARSRCGQMPVLELASSHLLGLGFV